MIDVLAIIAGVISVALATIVVVQGGSTQFLRWAYAFFAGGVGFWAIFLGLFLVIDSASLAPYFVTLYYTIGLFIPYAFLLFSYAYLSIPLSKFVKIFAIVPWFVMSILIAVPGVMVQSIDSGAAKEVELVPGMYILYSLIFFIYTAIGLVLLVKNATRTSVSLRHRRIVAISLLVGFAGGGYFDIILPLLGNYDLIVYGPLFAFLTSAGIFYVIAKHGLFDIKFTVVRAINYALTLATIGAVYLLVAFLVFTVLLDQSSSSAQLTFNLVLTVVLALLFQPVKLFFDLWTNRIFYRYTYSAEQVFREVNDLLATTNDLRSLLASVARTMAAALKAKQAFFFVYSDEGFVSTGTARHARLALKEMRWLDKVQFADSARIFLDRPSSKGELHSFMVSHRLSVIVPLKREDVIIGYFFLGEHQKSSYTSRDIQLLETISNELVIAIQNTLVLQEVKDLNAHLEQRIDASTKELRRSNEQLKKLDEAKDEFISMASHQLRTPLTSIKGYISMLIEGDVGHVTKDQKKLLEEAFISSERMVRLIGDFLNVSRLQTGKFVIDKHPVDLAQLVEDELDALSTNAAARGLSFKYKKPKKIPLLAVDENKIQQVIMNFADNALYYSKEKSKITVQLKMVGDWLEFTVKDTGIGVPKEQQTHLFQKFFRATNARQQRPDGTGVGLFLAKKVIDAHDGEIIFNSIENKGSTFGFRLPVKKLRA